MPYRARPDAAVQVVLRPRRRRKFGLVGLAAVLGAYVAHRAHRSTPAASLAPRQGAQARPSVSLLEPELQIAAPLAPLLAADGAEAASLTAPPEGTSRILRGRRLVLTFNRLMVSPERVGSAAEAPVARFDPTVPGTFRWVSRSMASFEPADGVWDREVDAALTLDPALRSLAGETVAEVGERRVVFDGAARVDLAAMGQRVAVGQPITIGMSRDVGADVLAREMLVYEVGAGGRQLSFTLRRRSVEADGRARFDLLLARGMAPGARIGVAFAPSRWPSQYPASQLPNLEVEFEPPPQVEGVACPAEAGGQCSFGAVPGEIVDVSDVLRLRASVALGPVDPSQVSVRPPVPGLAVRAVERTLSLTAEWAPDQVYEVRVAGLRSADGVPLRALAPLAVRSRGLPPEVRVHTGLVTVEREAAAELPVTGVHVAAGDIWHRDVAAGEEAMAASMALLRTSSGEAPRWTSTALASALPGASPNRWAAGRVSWGADDRGAQMRVVELVADRTQTGSAGMMTVVQRTDLGLHAQAMRGGVLVWATSIARASPLEGVDLRIGDGATTHRARTDASGVAWVVRAGHDSVEQTLTVTASRGDDRAVLVLDPRRAIRPGGLGLAEGEDPPASTTGTMAMMFTDRGVVRPGERLHTAGVLRRRRADGLYAVTGRSVEVELSGPDGVVDAARSRSSRFGSVSADFEVPRTARPGAYTATMREAAGERAVLATAEVQVADHRPPRVRADLVVESGRLMDGEALRASVESRLLIGAPLRDAPVRWTVTREGKAPDPPGHGGYVFGVAGPSTYPPVAATSASTTDARGTASASLPMRSAYPQRERVRVEVTVRDAAGGETSASRRLTLLPAEVEVGLRALPPFVSLGTAVDPTALAVASDGSPVVGQAVRLTIHREGWRAWWERDDSGSDRAVTAGFVARRSLARTAEHECTLRSATDGVACAWTPTHPGAFIVAAEVRDAHGRVSVTTQRLYVAGPGHHPDRDPPGARITLTPQRAQLSAGETAHIAVECPWPEGEALITVARGAPLFTARRRLVAGGNVLEIPISAAMAPNAFVTVTLVRPRTGALRPLGDLDLDAPDLRWGATELAVSPELVQLSVDWTTPVTLEGSSAHHTSTVRVRDAAGNPVRAELTVYAVEEGTLRLSAYQTPSPMRSLFRREAPQFALEDLRRTLLSRVTPLALPGASGDGPEGDALLRDDRERFNPTPVWLPRRVTDAQGEAQVTLDLPNRAAGYRLFAVAIDRGGRSGAATRELTVRKALVLEAMAPRAVFSGDHYDATAVLHNTSDRALDVALTTSREGRSVLVRTVTVAAGAEARVPVPVDADGERVALEFRAVANGIAEVTSATTVVLPTTRRARALRLGVIAANGTLELRDIQTADRSQRVTLSLSTSPMLGLGAAIASLLEGGDDDGSTGAARVLGLASAARVNGASVGGGMSSAALRQEGERALASLVARQSTLGGFGEWPGETESSGTTLLSFEALLAARRVRWTVPEGAMTRATRRVESMTRGEDGARETGLSIDDRAWAAMLLRAAGAPVTGLQELHERRDLMSPFGRAALALAMSPFDLRARSLVVSAAAQLEATRRGDRPGYRWSVGEGRVIATLLRAAVVHAPDRVTALAASLSALRDGRGDGAWRDPADTAAALDAFAEATIRCASDAPVEARVSIGGHALTVDGRSRSTLRFIVPTGAATASLAVRSDVPLYFGVEATRDVALGAADDVARGRGVSLHRVFETVAGEVLADGATVRVGELVRVRLFVHSEEATPAVMSLRDPLGGGFEPVDTAFETTPRGEVMALVGAGPEDDAMDARVFHALRSVDQIVHRSLRPQGVVYRLSEGQGLREFTFAVRATTAGRFALPPATLDARFSPELVARSGMVRFTVAP